MSAMLDPHICERARLARDPRFDGLFFTGVLSTGIFCRPICPAPQPKARNVVYFPSAAAATGAGLRPCLRCRPESAPGTPAWNGTSATVARAMALIRQGALDAAGIESLAGRLGVGARHLRRLFAQHLGASPIAMANTQRVLFAKKLLGETPWPVTEIALSAGFGSIRRFNAAFRAIYGQSPSAFRRDVAGRHPAQPAWFQGSLTLPYRPPYQWARMLAFYNARAIAGVETVTADGYRRTVRCQGGMGTIQVAHAPTGHALVLTMALPDSSDLMPLVERVRRMFDLDANVAAVNQVLMADRLLAPLIQRLDGLRPPGAWDPFETAVRAVVGQQISVKAARTILGRIAALAGPAIGPADPLGLTHCFPTAEELLGADLARVGMSARRRQTLQGLAQAVADGTIDLGLHTDLEDFVQRLTRLPGIGPWTAQYIALRALGEPDAFPAGDLGLAQALARNGQRPTQRQILARAEAWRPWRAYAATYLWSSLGE
jgi:AraC family transcriptional regulator, regulatory protein of adaptative response / DNA-3-methyladenine glycosylase II